MSDHSIVLIENPCRLSVDIGRIKLERHNEDDVFIKPSDIDVFCLHCQIVQLTVPVLQVLMDAGVVVVLTNNKHEPCGQCMSLTHSHKSPSRLRSQISFEQSDCAKEIWQQIIEARVLSEASVLRRHQLKGALYLERAAKKVGPSDSNNIEAQAAKHYWLALFGGDFKRHKQGAVDPINSCLNYGYAILRAMIARSLVMHGLNPAIGIWHASSENAFNLVDDLIEPYRWMVETHVKELMNEQPIEELNSVVKQQVLRFISQTVFIADLEYRLHSAIDLTVQSYLAVLSGRKENLSLPGG